MSIGPRGLELRRARERRDSLRVATVLGVREAEPRERRCVVRIRREDLGEDGQRQVPATQMQERPARVFRDLRLARAERKRALEVEHRRPLLPEVGQQRSEIHVRVEAQRIELECLVERRDGLALALTADGRDADVDESIGFGAGVTAASLRGRLRHASIFPAHGGKLPITQPSASDEAAKVSSGYPAPRTPSGSRAAPS